MPLNDEQPSAVSFARLQEQMTAVAADIAEIKNDLKEGRINHDGRIDALFRALSEERQQRVEGDNMLRLEAQKLIGEMAQERRAAIDALCHRQEAAERGLEALRWQFRWVGGILVVVSGLLQWGIGMALRLAGR